MTENRYIEKAYYADIKKSYLESFFSVFKNIYNGPAIEEGRIFCNQLIPLKRGENSVEIYYCKDKGYFIIEFNPTEKYNTEKIETREEILEYLLTLDAINNIKTADLPEQTRAFLEIYIDLFNLFSDISTISYWYGEAMSITTLDKKATIDITITSESLYIVEEVVEEIDNIRSTIRRIVENVTDKNILLNKIYLIVMKHL